MLCRSPKIKFMLQNKNLLQSKAFKDISLVGNCLPDTNKVGLVT